MMDIQDEITLELCRLQRAAIERVRRRNAEHQLGEAWQGIDIDAQRVDADDQALDPALAEQ